MLWRGRISKLILSGPRCQLGPGLRIPWGENCETVCSSNNELVCEPTLGLEMLSDLYLNCLKFDHCFLGKFVELIS